METNSNDKLDEKKVDTIKLRLLEMETDNIVKKESNPAITVYKSIISYPV